ncbi:YehS family protein [Lysobacter humi (ex Lee et al. 2017)]
MINNDVLRSLRYMLDLGDVHVAELMRLADPAFEIERAEVQAYLRREDEPEFAPLDDRRLALFLDGLVIDRRGRQDGAPPRAPETRLTNNLVLKKLRVAFELKDVDLLEMFQAAGRPVTKPELSALFRQPGHANFRPCGDQLLRYFLRGLTLRIRGP